ncbi:HIT domain-containing protein [Halosegnis sp.]|uniref:HIT family protein n=1 Tax=Halosegnis sp. TaxID=2864959 RepID=UPI0035D46D31
MDRMFAPWRIEWVEREDDPIDGCPFCVLPDRPDARDALVLARNDHAFVVLNNYPYNPGHAMVVPHHHTGKYRNLETETLTGLARLKQRTFDALETALHPDAFNTGMNLGGPAGGSITDHVHVHVVPRWDGDTNFMPVISDTKVIVEAVNETYDRVRAAFAELEGARDPGDEAAVEF